MNWKFLLGFYGCWFFGLQSFNLAPPKIDKYFIIALLGPTLFHTIGHISTCVSFYKVAVSFTHVIKSAKPVFSVVLQNFKQVNGLNLYGWITHMSLFYLFPVAVFVEGSQWVSGYHKAIVSIGTPPTFYLWVLISGVFYHLYNQSSYQALDDISPLTFSVGNTMKRVVVTVSTVIVFRNPVRPLNALGSSVAIFGTFLYSRASSKM
ncbi:putative sugar phosphate transporter domain-containing protein [Helianthus anomalus]